MKETALITGASGGLGEEFARLCAADKHDLVLVARSKDKLSALAAELSAKHGINAHVIAVDLSTPEGCRAVMQETDKRGIAVTLLINNAGFGTYGPFALGDATDQHTMMELNMVALTSLTRQILPGMIQRGHGRILNIASTAAFAPGPLMAVYYATKAYVLSFSLALSNELQGTGVTATCLCPGPTKTGFATRAQLEKSNLFKHHVMSSERVANIGYRACMNGRPLIVAGMRNKIMTFATRFAPRKLAAAIARHVQAEA